MANLKEIRSRIASVSSTKQITSAMKMVSAAKLRRAQDGILSLRPYANKLNEVVSRLVDNLPSGDSAYSRERDVKKVLLVVITSNRGMCGAFNSSVVKAALNHAQENYKDLYEKGNVHFLTIGKKGADVLKNRKVHIVADHSKLFEDLEDESVFPLAYHLMSLFGKEEYDRIELVYNQFKNAAVYNLMAEQFLPFVNKNSDTTELSDYIYEPSQSEILERVIPISLQIQLLKALLDSFAAEHGARMTAMHKATDNATELLRNLTLTYNKARQAAITNELNEIVGGADALKG
jgi:F-type H+-transporting ATPase subunit gamma